MMLHVGGKKGREPIVGCVADGSGCNPRCITFCLHCSSFLGLPFRILNIDLVKPKKGTTMEAIGRVDYTTKIVIITVHSFIEGYR